VTLSGKRESEERIGRGKGVLKYLGNWLCFMSNPSTLEMNPSKLLGFTNPNLDQLFQQEEKE